MRLDLLGSALAVVASFASVPASANTPPEVQAEIAAQRLSLQQLSNGDFIGSGWDRLVADAAAAQFTMVGEQHGSGAIAGFEIALHRALASRGYTNSAYEVGPYSMRFAEGRVRQGRGKLAAFIARPGNGFTIPFLFFGEEAKLTEDMVTMSPDHEEPVWGLDQEFLGAGPIHVALLSQMARSARERTAVERLRTVIAADAMAAGKLTEDQIADLRSGFADNGEALRLIDALAESAAIYRPFLVKGGGDIYSANLARETMMKRLLVADYAASARRLGRPPKVFFKFGANHSSRGFSDTNVPALGNFVSEWATSMGKRMVNVFVECDGGEAMNPQTNTPEPCQSHFDKPAVMWKAVEAGPPLQIYDLRPLRSRLSTWSGVDEPTRKLILAYDYYVTIRGGRAATPLGTLPATPAR
jgi:hypothetical protein